jgi:hypothetical protein
MRWWAEEEVESCVGFGCAVWELFGVEGKDGDMGQSEGSAWVG